MGAGARIGLVTGLIGGRAGIQRSAESALFVQRFVLHQGGSIDERVAALVEAVFRHDPAIRRRRWASQDQGAGTGAEEPDALARRPRRLDRGASTSAAGTIPGALRCGGRSRWGRGCSARLERRVTRPSERVIRPARLLRSQSTFSTTCPGPTQARIIHERQASADCANCPIEVAQASRIVHGCYIAHPKIR